MRPVLLLTRPRAQAERFAADARAHLGDAVDVIISPILQIALRPVAAAEGAVLIFSSENAVRAAAQSGIPPRTAYCVGDRTAAAAQEAGFAARSAQGDAQDLIEMIAAEAPPHPLVYLHGQSRRIDVAAALRAQGLSATSQTAYDQLAQPLSQDAREALEGPRAVVLPLFSPRSAALVSDQAKAATAPLYPIALSPQVAAAWTGPTAALRTAERPDGAQMLHSLALLLRDSLP